MAHIIARITDALSASSARLLLRFTEWFSSAACVWQTAILVVGVAVAEIVFPKLDAHGFWLLWALTLYSGATQPALAYSNQLAARQTDELLSRVESLERQIDSRLARIEAHLGVVE